MTIVGQSLALGMLATLLSACSEAPMEPAAAPPSSDGATETTSSAMNEAETGQTGSGEGTITSLGSKGDFVTIDHGPIEGLMGAMTMGFEVVSDVDMSGLAEGDIVAFTVKHGRDGVYRVTTICKTTEGDATCLADDQGD